MSGHGHVYPNKNGAVARCGGPGLCRECSAEKAQKDAEDARAVAGRLNSSPLFTAPVKPDFKKIGESLAESYEQSAFATPATLAGWIAHELEGAWIHSARLEEQRIEQFCKEKGWIK